LDKGFVALDPSINSSSLKNLNFSDTARPHEFFDHTGKEFGKDRLVSHDSIDKKI
jgi:hypothetical protein